MNARFMRLLTVAGLAAGALVTASGGVSADAVVPTSAGAFVALTPANVLDTGTGVGAPAKAVAAHSTVTFTVAGRGGVPSTGVAAVQISVGAVATASGFATVFPAGTARPAAASLDFSAGQTIMNLTVVGLGTGTNAGRVSIYNGSSGSVRFESNVFGYYVGGSPTAPGAFRAVTPANVLDTGTGVGAPAAPVAPHTSVTFQVSGRGGVPATGAGSAALIVAVVAPGSSGFASVYPGGTAVPPAASLDFLAGQNIANLTVTGFGTGTAAGQVSIYNGSSSPVRIVANVLGYYLGGTPVAAGMFGSLAPANLLDSGTGVGQSAPGLVPAHGSVTVQITGRGGVPANAGAVALTVAAVAPSAAGYATVYPSDATRPPAAALSFGAGPTIANLVVVGVSATGRVTLYNGSSAPVRLVANVAGFWLAGPDTLPPAPVTDLRRTAIDSTSGELFWHDPTDRDFTQVKVCSSNGDEPAPPDCAAIATVPAGVERYVATGLSPDTLYNYTLYAQDAAGNESAQQSTSVLTQLSGTASITGSVTDTASTGNPLADVIVTVSPQDFGSSPRTTVTGADGSYQVTGLAAGKYTVCFDGLYATGGTATLGYLDRCFVNTSWDGDQAPATAALVAVKSGATTKNVNGTLFAAGEIRGTVVAQDGGAGIAGVWVQITPVTAPSTQLRLPSLQTGTDGSYVLRGVAPVDGGYHVCFNAVEASGGPSATGYSGQCFKNVAWNPLSDVPAGTAVSVGANGIATNVNAVLPSGGAVSGTVTNGTSGVSDVLASVYTSGGVLAGIGATNDAGSYRVVGLPPGTYFVCFDAVGVFGGSPNGYLSQCYHGRAWDAQTAPSSTTADGVNVTAGATSTAIGATLAPASAISGTVSDSHGPVTSVTATAYAPDGTPVASGSSADDGTYLIPGLAAGSYFVCFDASNASGSSATGYLDQCYNGQAWDGSSTPTAPPDTAVSVGVSSTKAGVDATLTAAS